ncbi:MAG: hypothetical protein JNK82_45640 [Myxococcaceae bacterium]|nr:hypothetical protein [Myxococcaceae bacterium]
MMTFAWVLVALTSAPISVDYRGTLGEALNAIATKGELSLIATGDLGVQAEVHLKDVTAEQALEALVKVHGLELHHEGPVWVVKPAAAAAAAAAATAPAPVAVPAAPPAAPAPPPKPSVSDSDRKVQMGTGSVSVPDGEHVDDVVAYGGSVTLGNGVHADGDIVAFGGDVLIGDGTTIEGDAVAFGGQVKRGEGSVVKGEEVSIGGGVKPLAKALPAVKVAEKKQDHEGGGVAAFLVFFATFFGLGFLLMMFAPNRMRNIEAEIRNEPVKSGLAGLLAAIGWFPLSIFLFVTLVGIPVMLAMWLLGPLALVMGMLALANHLGTKFPLMKKRRTQAAVLAVGLLIIMLVAMVPVLGQLTVFTAACVSFGAIIRTRVGQRGSALPVAEGPFQQVGA